MYFLSGLSSFTFLYGWLPSHFEWIVVIYISARMTTISFRMDCCHAHFCTDDYHLFLNGFSSFTYIIWITTISFWKDCRHLHFCTNDYHFFLSGLLSCTFLYGWLRSLFEWIFVMHISVQWLSIFFVYGFSSCIFCANDFPYSCTWIFHDVSNALQRVNSMEQWRIINDITM